MAGKVVEICEEKINPIIEKMGYDVVEVEYAKKADGMNLTFYIDKKEGITLDDCESVHKTIELQLDDLNVSDDKPYILNVSSCGLDRPVKNQKDFLRNKGKKVTIKLFSLLGGKKTYVGILTNFSDSGVEIKLEDNNLLSFEKDKVALIEPVIEF